MHRKRKKSIELNDPQVDMSTGEPGPENPPTETKV